MSRKGLANLVNINVVEITRRVRVSRVIGWRHSLEGVEGKYLCAGEEMPGNYTHEDRRAGSVRTEFADMTWRQFRQIIAQKDVQIAEHGLGDDRSFSGGIISR